MKWVTGHQDQGWVFPFKWDSARSAVDDPAIADSIRTDVAVRRLQNESLGLIGSKEQGAFRDFVDGHRRNDAGVSDSVGLCQQPGCRIDQERKGSDQNTEEQQTND